LNKNRYPSVGWLLVSPLDHGTIVTGRRCFVSKDIVPRG